MKIIKIIFRGFSLLVITGILALTPVLSGCGSGEDTTNTTKTKSIPFAVHVTPMHMDDTIAGLSYVFLVTVDYGTQKVTTTAAEGTETTDSNLAFISASADNATVTVGPKSIAEGYVAEVVVIPDEEAIGSTLTVTVKAEWNGHTDTEAVTLNVGESPSSLEDLTLEAVKIRNMFVAWLAINYLDLGISLDEVWSGTSVYPNTTVIKYFLFFSEEWEIGIRWNTSSASVDWAQMYIRLRTVEFSPSQAFEIASISTTNPEIYEISPPEEVWR
jgi:hypothetical protein